MLDRALLSQDSGWYHVGEPNGGSYRGYSYIYTGFVPTLDPAWARKLLVEIRWRRSAASYLISAFRTSTAFST